MKNKIINVIQSLLVSYLLSMLFIILAITIINDSIIVIAHNKFIVISIFTILPLAPMSAIYMYLGIKDVKHASNKAYALQHEEIEVRDKQINELIKMDGIRMGIIDSKQEEIDELKRELAEIAKEAPFTLSKEVRDKLKNIGEPNLPFNEDNDTREFVYMCPECNELMPRHTDKIAFCDNIECTRKQWRKDKL